MTRPRRYSPRRAIDRTESELESGEENRHEPSNFSILLVEFLKSL